MDKRIALIGIIVEEIGAAEKVNELLHEYGSKIVGRMGIPYETRGVSIISVVLDATPNEISTLAGKLGRIQGIKVKSMQAKVGEDNVEEN